MRPAGDIRKALLDALTPGLTLREWAAQAKVGADAARRTVDNLCRAGAVARGDDRRVDYRNRPVATYVPRSMAVAANDAQALTDAMRAWGEAMFAMHAAGDGNTSVVVNPVCVAGGAV